MSEAADLYGRDFYAWTQDQASALRALPERLRSNALDVEHLAEEVEGLGASERRAAMSLMLQIVVHLLKLRLHPDRLPWPHWAHEVDVFRVQLRQVFKASPSLRARRADLAEEVWGDAARLVARDLLRDGHAAAAAEARAFTAAPPYFDLDREVLDEDWFPPRP
jgi:hypothetical protein